MGAEPAMERLYLDQHHLNYSAHFSRSAEQPPPHQQLPAPPVLNKKKTRTMFNYYQLSWLETTFQQAPYLDARSRCELANQLGLDESRVQVWFQNRRAKWRKKVPKQAELKWPRTQFNKIGGRQ